MKEHKKAAVPYPSVGADGGQPLAKDCTESISEIQSQDNWDMSSFYDPSYLYTLTQNALYEESFPIRSSVIEGILKTGIYLLAGAPKIGKSFLVAQIAYHVSTGQNLWSFPVSQGDVLYLALEDSFQRLQDRLFHMFGEDASEHLHLATNAKQLSNGLEPQFETFLRRYPQTKLIVIDTLQKIRESQDEKYSYAKDYEIIGKLKSLADYKNICILLVHHTRKQNAEDKFDRISGTTGLLGAVDGALLMEKESRTSNKATLDITSRDAPDQRLHLIRNESRLTWDLELAENELWKEPPDPVLEAVASLLSSDMPSWSGSATQLAKALQSDLNPNVLSMRLNVKASSLFRDHHIRFERVKGHNGRVIHLTLEFPKA